MAALCKVRADLFFAFSFIPASSHFSPDGQMRTNSFEICDGEQQSVGVGLYPALHLLNHACRPACAVTFRGPRAQVYSCLLESIMS